MSLPHCHPGRGRCTSVSGTSTRREGPQLRPTYGFGAGKTRGQVRVWPQTLNPINHGSVQALQGWGLRWFCHGEGLRIRIPSVQVYGDGRFLLRVRQVRKPEILNPEA